MEEEEEDLGTEVVEGNAEREGGDGKYPLYCTTSKCAKNADSFDQSVTRCTELFVLDKHKV